MDGVGKLCVSSSRLWLIDGGPLHDIRIPLYATPLGDSVVAVDQLSSMKIYGQQCRYIFSMGKIIPVVLECMAL